MSGHGPIPDHGTWAPAIELLGTSAKLSAKARTLRNIEADCLNLLMKKCYQNEWILYPRSGKIASGRPAWPRVRQTSGCAHENVRGVNALTPLFPRRKRGLAAPPKMNCLRPGHLMETCVHECHPTVFQAKCRRFAHRDVRARGWPGIDHIAQDSSTEVRSEVLVNDGFFACNAY